MEEGKNVVDEPQLSLNDIYTFMKAMGENLERKIEVSTNTLTSRINEVNENISADLEKLATKQINDDQDRRVQIERVSNVFTDHKAAVDEDISSMKEQLRVHQKQLENQELENLAIKTDLGNANKEIHWQMLRIKELETSVHRGLQHGRGWNVEIEGIPINVGDEPPQLQAAVIKILSAINVPIETFDIDTVHRLPSKNEPKTTIVRFCSRKTVRLVHENKHKLRDLALLDIEVAGLNANSRIYINASQCTYYKSLAYNCRLLKRKGLIAGHFTSKEGKIYH